MSVNLVPKLLNLQSGTNIFSINNDNTALKFYNKYELTNTQPQNNNVMLFQNSGVSSFTNLIGSLNNYYVSPSGSDTSGAGTIFNPYKTISKVITILNALSGDITATVNLACGSYSENVSITKSGISIVGGSSLPNLTIINGNITFNMSQNSSSYSVGGLSNFIINGTIEQDNGTLYPNSLVINNIISVSQSGKNNIIQTNSGAGVLCDMTVQNSLIYANSDTIAISMVGSMTMVGTQITNNPSLTATTLTFVYVNAAGRFNAFGCTMFQTSTSASVAALITIANTSNATSSTTINNCVLLFTASTSTTTGAIILFSNSASSNTCNFYNNYVKTNCSINSPNNYIILRTGTGAINFTFGNCLGTSGNHTVPASSGSYVKTTMNAVV